ncbi:RNA polymerase sigma factor [Actinophytocola sediminis]
MDDTDPTAGQPTDAELLAAVRAGDLGAYGELFRRHAAAVFLAARQWTSQSSEQQDLVADAFARTLNAIGNGAGPRESPLAYLLTTVRRLGIVYVRHRNRVALYGTEPRIGGEVTAAVDDAALRRWHLELVRAAFQALPPRWQAVLWHTEVERRSPAELAARLDMSPNGVAALAMRAREGLRQAYLQAQVPSATATSCVTVRQQLGTWTRRGGSRRRCGLIDAHLAVCQECRETAEVLAESNDELRTGKRAS